MAVTFCTVCGSAWSQGAPDALPQYPSKTVRLIVPYGPRGPSDLVGRALAENLAESLGQTVVVENRPGAGGTVGTEIAAKAAPDGYTMVLVSQSFTINAALYTKLGYDTLRDFTPLRMLAVSPYVFVAHARSL